jgi:hypothetical protein
MRADQRDVGMPNHLLLNPSLAPAFIMYRVGPEIRFTSLVQFLYLQLFNDIVSNSDSVTSEDWMIVNWKGRGKKQPWNNLRSCSDIQLERD